MTVVRDPRGPSAARTTAANATIAAIASPPGAGLRGVIRISGPRARELVLATWVGAPPDLARRAMFRGRLRDTRGEQPLRLLWMPGPHSFTREDVAELHLPGASALLASALAKLYALGARAAEPGEFTRRAFVSGRIDLTRAEGVLSLVRAQNETQRRASTALLFGGLADRVARLREGLEDLRALCEATLDFDESDTGHVPDDQIERLGRAAIEGLERALDWEIRRTEVRGEARIVLAGAPNAGKSALFNALLGRERALVSDFAGTTRDALAERLDIGCAVCRLFDTAGFDARAHGPDGAAQAVARAVRTGADLVLWLVDATRTDHEQLASEIDTLAPTANTLLVWNKIDRADASPEPPEALLAAFDRDAAVVRENRKRWIAISAVSGAGLDPLRARVATALGLEADSEGALGSETARVGAETASLGRELSLRHRHALERARSELVQGFANKCDGGPLELLAEHARAATEALDAVTGQTTSEAILDRIFARFCIGK